MALRDPYVEALTGPQIVERLDKIDERLASGFDRIEGKLDEVIKWLTVIARNSAK